MWIFTTIGFFSVVEHRASPGLVVIRARYREDLARLRVLLPALGPALAAEGTDYPFRAIASKRDWAGVLQRLGEAINYPNFKDEAAKFLNRKRAGQYLKVWSVMRGEL